MNCSKFEIFEKQWPRNKFWKFPWSSDTYYYTNDTVSKSLKGIVTRPGYIRKFIRFNEFEKKETKIPDGFVKKKVKDKQKFIKKYKCDSSRNPLEFSKFKNVHSNYPKTKYKRMYVHDNGGKPFLIIYSTNDVHVYRPPTEVYNNYYINTNNKMTEWHYMKHVRSFKNVKQMFKGTGTMLLHLRNQEYVIITERILSFKIPNKVLKYQSPIFGSNVTYPYIVDSKQNTYVLDFDKIILIPSTMRKTWSSKNYNNNPHGYYYNMTNKEQKQMKKIPFKVLQKRLMV